MRLTGEAGPVVVRPHPDLTGEYELLVGDEFWYAATEAQLRSLSGYVCEAPGLSDALERLDELAGNPRRNVIQTAQVLQGLYDLIPHPQRQGRIPHRALADLSGLSRVVVTHYLSLLSLPPRIGELLAQGRLTFRHGKVLCSSALGKNPERQSNLAEAAAKNRWSVRRLEAEVRGPIEGSTASSGRPPSRTAPPQDLVMDPNIQQLADSLSDRLGSPVEIEHGRNGSGRMIFRYFSLDILEGMLESMGLRREQ